MKKSTIQALSFLSGLTLAAVIIGITVNRSATLRTELEHQMSSVLKTTGSLVDAYKSLAHKSKTAATLIQTDSGEKTAKEQADEAAEQAQISSQWDAVEKELSH
ncbi:MAG: hypothetical protein LBP91_04045 [Coriobacteriales bacterium]|jgi:hypothetical protein|nr:hypothetical protein [Coriobacteriales bacterium]